MTQPEPGDALTAALLQITAHAEHLAALDQRETGHHHDTSARLAELAKQGAAVTAQVAGIQAAAERQAAILDALDGLDQQVATLTDQITDIAERGGEDAGPTGAGYQPSPTPRWWKLDRQERADAVARLRAWVEQVYRPGYGHLAAALGPCWDQHPVPVRTRLAHGTLDHPLPGRQTHPRAARQPGRMAHPPPARPR